MDFLSDGRSERWSLKPLSCPRPIRYCPACGEASEFVCSERFRINAQKKVIDVWLHYRCSDCGGAWKYPVLERQSIASLDAAEYEAYVRHEPTMVWKHAFDIARLRTHVNRVDANVELAVKRHIVVDAADPDELFIELDVRFPCVIRLDRLLATELCVSRATIQQWNMEGRVRVINSKNGALNQRTRDGQKLLLVGVPENENRPSQW